MELEEVYRRDLNLFVALKVLIEEGQCQSQCTQA